MEADSVTEWLRLCADSDVDSEKLREIEPELDKDSVDVLVGE